MEPSLKATRITTMNATELIAFLNAVRVGELDGIRGKLLRAREACVQLEQGALAEKLEEAEQALARADMKTYRKRLEAVVSRLGHLR